MPHDFRFRSLSKPICDLELLADSGFVDRLRRKGMNSGERRLLAAILQDAVAVYCRDASARDPETRHLAQDAARWVESTDRTWALSFERVCETLGMDARELRRCLRQEATAARVDAEEAFTARAGEVPVGVV